MLAQSAAAEPTEAVAAELRSRLRGDILGRGDRGYDAARRVWNGMIDKRPALIARCTGAADVAAAVAVAREHDLLVAVRGGGHNVAGNAVCDGGLVIDLSPMKGIRVDAANRTARAQPGRPGAISTTRRNPSASPPPAASSAPPASPASPSAAASAG